MRTEIRNTLLNITNTVLLIIVFFLVARILFRLFSANPLTPFVSWTYTISGFLMKPFIGIFRPQSTSTGILDIPAIFSTLAYLVLGLIVMYLIHVLTTEPQVEPEDDRLYHGHRREIHTHTH